MPETFGLPYETDPTKVRFFHGTSAAFLPDIDASGLRPRALHQGGTQWEKHPSHPDVVYLSTAYALHYANNALSAGDLAAIVEVDGSKLGELYADEDSYALVKVQGMDELNGRPVAERVAFWRENLKDTLASESLRVLGNCTHWGTIPPEAVIKVRLLTPKEVARFVMSVTDPTIAPMNYRFYGGMLQRFSAWLVDPAAEADATMANWFGRAGELTYAPMSLAEAAEVVRNLKKVVA